MREFKVGGGHTSLYRRMTTELKSKVRSDAGEAARIDKPAAYVEGCARLESLLARGEYSQRTLDVTSALVKLMPGNYTVWSARFEALSKAGPAALYSELVNMAKLVKLFLKTYQVWQHRRNIVGVLDDSGSELEFSRRILDVDMKNYHTWVYRRYVLEHFYGPGLAERRASSRPETSSISADESASLKIWADELDFVTQQLNADVRNNSLWSHRFYILFEAGAFAQMRTVAEEAEYVKECIAVAPSSASAWAYYAALCRRGAEFDVAYARQMAAHARGSLYPVEDGRPAVEASDMPPHLSIPEVYMSVMARGT